MRFLGVFLLLVCVFASHSIAISVSGFESERPEKCLALAISGGGDKGAYEAGVLRGLVENLPSELTQWQVVTGISAGSIVGGGLAIYNIGDEMNATAFMEETALSLRQKDIFQQWPGGILDGLLNHNSLFDNSPLRATLSRIMKRGFGNRHFLIGATNIADGSFKYWTLTQCNQTPDPLNCILDAGLASSAIPGIFPIQVINGSSYVDGGTKYGVDVFNAITRCQELGYDDHEIIIDIVLCEGTKLAPINPSSLKTLDVLLRAASIVQYDNSMEKIEEIKLAFPKITFRYQIYPSSPIPGTGIDFDPVEMQKMVELGHLDAKNAIKAYAYAADAYAYAAFEESADQ